MKKFAIINIDDKIDFKQVEQQSSETCRKSKDGLNIIVSYTGDTPEDLKRFKKYTEKEIKEIMNTKNWKSNEEII